MPYEDNVGRPDDRWPAAETRAYLRAWTASQSDDELEMLVSYARHSGHINGQRRIGLTISGWRHLEDMDATGPAADQAFVAMWFGHDMADTYSDGIEPAVLKAGYRPMRIDKKEHSNKIDDEIIAEIRRSRFVVADFTSGAVDTPSGEILVARGGVYYEAGFAQGLGLPVIWSCRADQVDRVHFDTRQFNHITWSNPEELQVKLINRIAAVIGDGPHRRENQLDKNAISKHTIT